jgi:hypothetical protein
MSRIGSYGNNCEARSLSACMAVHFIISDFTKGQIQLSAEATELTRALSSVQLQYTSNINCYPGPEQIILQSITIHIALLLNADLLIILTNLCHMTHGRPI